MRRIVIVCAFAAAVTTAAPAFAKGDLVEIGVSGGGLTREVRIPGSNADAPSRWGAPASSSNDPYYVVVFYVRIPGESRLFATSPMRYYPGDGGRPAVLRYEDISPSQRHLTWMLPGASLARRLDAAISSRRAGRSPTALVTSWPLVGLDVIVLVLFLAVVRLVRRGGVKLGRTPAPEAPA